MGPVEQAAPRAPETIPEQLRRIAESLPRDSREWAELHRISGYVEALEDHIESAISDYVETLEDHIESAISDYVETLEDHIERAKRALGVMTR